MSPKDWKWIWNSVIIEEEWENPSLKQARRILSVTQVLIAVCCITFVLGTGCAWHSSRTEAKPASVMQEFWIILIERNVIGSRSIILVPLDERFANCGKNSMNRSKLTTRNTIRTTTRRSVALILGKIIILGLWKRMTDMGREKWPKHQRFDSRRKKFQVGLTCCRGTHDIKDSTHTVRYYPLEDSVLREVHEFKPTTSPLRIPHTRGFSQLNYTSIPCFGS